MNFSGSLAPWFAQRASFLRLWIESKIRGWKVKAVADSIAAELKAGQLADSATLMLKIGLPFMIKEILGVGIEYGATLADENTFFRWFKSWGGRLL